MMLQQPCWCVRLTVYLSNIIELYYHASSFIGGQRKPKNTLQAVISHWVSNPGSCLVFIPKSGDLFGWLKESPCLPANHAYRLLELASQIGQSTNAAHECWQTKKLFLAKLTLHFKNELFCHKQLTDALHLLTGWSSQLVLINGEHARIWRYSIFSRVESYFLIVTDVFFFSCFFFFGLFQEWRARRWWWRGRRWWVRRGGNNTR